MKPMTKAERFFWLHAGFSYDPKKETKAQGKRRCAISLARAEERAEEIGLTFEWSDDWSVGSHQEFYGAGSAYEDSEPETCESCVVKDADGNYLASLGCIDDADHNYRRVIEAELASEALADMDAQTSIRAGYAATGVYRK